MEIPKLIILLCCTLCCIASEHSHNIPIEGYETELQDLGQHVEYPETPVKVIKITKTIAVKVPVPYPVKVTEKVPYPVHVAKPYPVPVPQIIKVPHVVSPTPGHSHEGGEYKVQENAHENHSYGSLPESHSFGGGQSGQTNNYDEDFSYEGSPGSSYDAPASSHYGQQGGSVSHIKGESFESKSYDQAITDYLNKHKLNGNDGYQQYY